MHQKHEPELKNKPLVLIDNADNISRARIIMCSDAASKKQVVTGMKLSQARAVCADVVWRERNGKLYDSEHKKLVVELIACSPRVTAQQAGTFLIDADGVQRMGGESKLCRDILKLVSRAGYVEGHIGIANSAFASLVASRAKNCRWHIVNKGADADRSFLSALSIDHLPLAAETYETFLELGVRTMGELAALTPESVLERFGKEGLDAHELVLGLDDRHPTIPPIEKAFQARVEIGGPIEALNDTLFIFKSMLDRLSNELRQNGLWADELQIAFFNDDEKFDERPITLLRSSNNAKFLLEVIRLSLEAKPLLREFTGVNLTVSRYSKEAFEQAHFEMTSQGPLALVAEFPEISKWEKTMLLLQRFTTRLGENSLVRPLANDQYFHDNAGLWVPVLQAKSGHEVAVDADYIARHAGRHALSSSLVLKKFQAPQPALVELKHSRLQAVTYQREWHRVIEITVPQCLSGMWWEEPVRRSCYTALIESPKGERALVSLVHEYEFEQHKNTWFIEGVFD